MPVVPCLKRDLAASNRAGGDACISLEQTLFSRKFCATLATFFVVSLSSAGAQSVTDKPEIKPPSVHPGNLIHYSIHFTGTDTGKIKGVILTLHARSPSETNQEAFVRDFQSDRTVIGSGGDASVDIRVPESVATGDYYLVADVYCEGFQFQYSEKEVGMPIQRITNDTRFHKPTITVKQKP